MRRRPPRRFDMTTRSRWSSLAGFGRARVEDPVTELRRSRHARVWPASRLDHPKGHRVGTRGGLDTLGRGRPRPTTEGVTVWDPVTSSRSRHARPWLASRLDHRRGTVSGPWYQFGGLDTLGRGRPHGSTTEGSPCRDPVTVSAEVSTRSAVAGLTARPADQATSSIGTATRSWSRRGAPPRGVHRRAGRRRTATVPRPGLPPSARRVPAASAGRRTAGRLLRDR